MKIDNLVYTIASIVVISAAIMKILHLPGASILFNIVVIAGFIYMLWQNNQLKKRIKELENNQAELSD